MLKKSVRADLKRLRDDLTAYRSAVDRIFSARLSKPRNCRDYFFKLLVSVSRLYLDYLLLVRELEKIHARKGTNLGLIHADTRREGLLRKRFGERLRALPCWKGFQAETAFSEITGLRTLTDYLNSFRLHLPEIYEETLRAEEYAKRLLKVPGDSGVDLMVSLEHLARNHVSFVVQALQWAADESTWP